ncbi:outer membrane beta-barrel protein [Botrimarina hoheduenensis]|uniref:Outer membrane protein beta-barrel domain-containing protein n=1 Tax=Botrimarina hoheduenensis TaxID=2528000 RepID=A0A5C5WES6_9BACT|nr:outer membrane beta-barrel protein [Botrimarina hoheduenensis]TWT48555.1 hypothetical protein Pla111_03280 [Botrimarina hoheduenensis]
MPSCHPLIERIKHTGCLAVVMLVMASAGWSQTVRSGAAAAPSASVRSPVALVPLAPIASEQGPLLGPGPSGGICPRCAGSPGACSCAEGINPAGSDDALYKHWLIDQLMLRHSSTHGRAMGPGQPLRGTSWLNRPLSFGLDVGGLFVTSSPSPNVRTNNDVLLAGTLGWDWDHYWGSQARLVWSTPHLENTTQPTVSASDNLFIADLSVLYYPWGDSRTRPYYRLGLGLTDVEYTQDDGTRRQDTLMTVPLAIGVKHQVRRWLSWRLELAENFAAGQNGTGDLHNLTLTTGLEWRFGGRSESQGWANGSNGW